MQQLGSPKVIPNHGSRRDSGITKWSGVPIRKTYLLDMWRRKLADASQSYLIWKYLQAGSLMASFRHNHRPRDLVDEGIHLASASQPAGFRGAVESLLEYRTRVVSKLHKVCAGTIGDEGNEDNVVGLDLRRLSRNGGKRPRRECRGEMRIQTLQSEND